MNASRRSVSFLTTVAIALAPLIAASTVPYATGQTLAPGTQATAPGTPLGTRPASDVAGRIFGAAAPAATVLSYSTTLQDGTPTVANASVFEPKAPWQGQGSRPTVIIAPGTRGEGDTCAPSRADLHLAAAAQTSTGPVVNIEYEYQTYQMALALGIRVVVPDYIGLGTPGAHSYVNNIEQAHALLDAARASLATAGLPADSPVGFAGYSQGGGAAAAAAEYAAIYAPELNVRGSYAGAPPADLEKVIQAVDGSAIAHVMGYAINGFIEHNPAFAQTLLPLLNEKGHAFLASAADSCIVDSVFKWGLTRSSTLTTTGESFSQIIERTPALRDILHQQKLGQHPLNAPMLISNSPTDDLIPYSQAQALGGDYCQQGGVVDFVAEPSLPIGSGQGLGHAYPFLAATPKGLLYLKDRFNGLPAPGNCSPQ